MKKTKQNKPVKSSLTKRSIQKFMKNRLAIVGLIGLFLLLTACICAPLLTSYDPGFIDLTQKSLPMSAEHPLGTDRLGRDLLARVLYGGRWSLLIGIAASLGTNLLAAILGCVSGYYGGKVDRTLVTVQEFMSLFPTTLIFILLAGITGRSINIVLAIWILTGWGGTMRIVRSRILSLKQEPFVESCRANGISSFSIMFHHMVPNTMGPIILNVTMNVGGYVLSEAGLTYLGIGLPADIPTWGNILNGAKRMDILLNEPLLWMVPGAAILLLTLSINFFGDGLRDALDSTTK
ncbi:MAG: ABC transporter permease [Ruminococcaceae bacterium]|jgi:peptide/nickel transport system permease protein|nr:ABC transporter permease [Anaerolineaceae bacterium]NLM76997.1 ABC transporter permease [Oscillospiraceae bacterium]